MASKTVEMINLTEKKADEMLAAAREKAEQTVEEAYAEADVIATLARAEGKGETDSVIFENNIAIDRLLNEIEGISREEVRVLKEQAQSMKAAAVKAVAMRIIHGA